MAPITTVSFDADETLWVFQPAARRALDEAYDELCRRVPHTAELLTPEQYRAIHRESFVESRPRLIRWEACRREAFRMTLKALSVEDDPLAAALTEFYLVRRFRYSVPFNDAKPTLDALAPDYALGLISNGNTYPDVCGLPGRFQFAVFSQDIGAIDKPDPRIFHEAMKQADCSAEQLVHVGDSPTSDVAGANGVGAVSVWLNRDEATLPDGIEPSHEIASLNELPDLLRSLSSRRGQF